MAADSRVSTPRTALTWTGTFLGLVLLLVFAWLLWRLLLLTFIATVIATGMAAPIDWIVRRGLPRIAAVVIAYVALLLLIGLALYLVIPPFISQLTALAHQLPDLVVRVQDAIQSTFGAQVAGSLKDAIGSIGVPGGLLQVPTLIFNALYDIAVILFLSALIVLQAETMWSWIARLLPVDQRQPLHRLMAKAVVRLGAYVRGQLIVMTITGVGALAGMLILGVPFAIPLGILAFVTEAIPIVGPFIAGGPILLAALIQSPLTALFMLLWFLALEQAEGWVFIPLVHAQVLNISPAVVLFAVAAGSTLAGILGALAALPIVAVLDTVVEEVFVPLRRLHARVEDESPP